MILLLLLVGAPATSQEVGELVRCPVCQGMSIADSPSGMARSMMERVNELHAEGKSEQEILAYFVERYGEWVLLRPPARGWNLLLWGLPAAALLVGLFVIRARARLRASGESPPRTPIHGRGCWGRVRVGGPDDEPGTDPYLRQIREELEQ